MFTAPERDPLAEFEAAIDKLGASDGPVDAARLWRLAERVEALKVRAARAYETSEEWRADGFLSAAAALLARCGVEHGQAGRALALGARLERLPHTAEAFAAGAISRHHASVVAEACTSERRDQIEAVEEHLSEVARRVRPRELRAVVRRLCDALDGDGGAADDAARHARRRLHVSTTLDGMVMIDGLLDAPAGEAVITCLRARMEADRSPGDTRAAPQRRADALVALCEDSLGAGMPGGSRRVRPHVTVVVDLEMLQGGTPVAEIDRIAEVRGEAAHVGHLSQATLEQISCDCAVSRVVTAGPSAVLDVGRATRVVPPALWKALVVRDRHCRAPGCDRPPGWCDAHHIVHWAHGGATDLANLELLCRRHHREAHGHAPIRGPGVSRAASP